MLTGDPRAFHALLESSVNCHWKVVNPRLYTFITPVYSYGGNVTIKSEQSYVSYFSIGLVYTRYSNQNKLNYALLAVENEYALTELSKFHLGDKQR